MEIYVKTAKDFESLTLFPLPISHSNFLKNFRKYKLVWTVFLWLSIYIYLTYSEKFSGFCSSRKSGSGYFVRSTWKFSEIYIFCTNSIFFVFLPHCSILMKRLHLMIKYSRGPSDPYDVITVMTTSVVISSIFH